MRLWSLLVLGLTACSQGTNVAPVGVLSKQTMVEVLEDILITEAGASHFRNIDELNYMMADRYAAVLKRHGISYEQFVRSYEHYLQQPAQLASIYDEVIVRLSAKEAAIRNSGNYQPAPISAPRQR
ncbi:MAG: DUF4296 domain-containing protein [Chitinophagales bacterium]|nr:DUF4296 domain-containing protein [Chitinophagales bacterium]MDW8428770.1 DUF4296 domain-containing protein [Chitinophagales bacterium]